MNKTFTLIAKNNDLMFALDFMCMWFCGNKKLSELDEEEVKYVQNLLFFNYKQYN